MRHYVSAILLLLTLTAQAQFSRAPKDPLVTGVTNMAITENGLLMGRVKGQTAKALALPAVLSKSGVRALTLSASAAPQRVEVTGVGGGSFYLDADDTTTADNTGTCLVTASGRRYKRVLPDRRITPDMFGAIPNDGADDGAALQAWLSSIETNELFLPAGKYHSSVQLLRTNLGAASITGAGSARSEIVFTANTNGIGVVNPLNGNYGSLLVRGIKITSTGTKTAGTEALRVTSQHEMRPGVTIEDVSIKALTAGQEWATGIRLHDCSGTYVVNVDIQGASLTALTGISITNDANRPAVEHLIINPRMRAVSTGISAVGTGYPSVEGVKIFGGEIASCTRGVYGSVSYGAPDFQIFGLHIYSFGQECVYLDGYQQVNIAGGSFYANKRDDGLLPTRALYFNDALDYQVSAKVVTRDSIPYAVEFDGSGSMNKVDLNLTVFAAPTKIAKVSAGYSDVPDFSQTKRIWSGNTTWGSTNPNPLNFVDGSWRILPSMDGNTIYPDEDKTLAFRSGRWQAVTSPARSYTTAIIASGGVNFSAGQIIVHNETLPGGSCSPGDEVTVSRVGGWSPMPTDFEVRGQVLEADKVRLYLHNTASTTKTFAESQFTLKITRK